MSSRSIKSRNSKEGTRGSDTMIRVVYATHLNLTQMADHKAHIMLGINTFLLSFVITKKKMGVLANAHNMLIPDIILVLFCMTCIVLALLVTRPRMPAKSPDPDSPQFNWMFFGHFAHANLEQFQKNILELANNPQHLHEAMVSDIYWMGQSLSAKYRYLRYCYFVFSIGMPVVIGIFLYFWMK